MTTLTPTARLARSHQIRRATLNLRRIARALFTLKTNTARGQDWSWVGDWSALADDLGALAHRVEQMAGKS